MFFRVKPARGYRYLQIARSVRVEGKVRQEIIGTLGRLDVLQESGQLDRLLRSGLRYCRQVKVLDAHAAGETEPVSILKIGPELVFGRLWQEKGIAEIIRELAAKRRYGFDLERAIYLTVLHRLFASGSDRAAEAWKENYCIPGAEQLALQHLYRAMAWLGEEIGEGVLGTLRCTKDLMEEALFDRGRDLFSEVGLVFFDTTSMYFEGTGGQSLGEHGHSKDHRPDLRQMVVGVALDVEGRPICCEMWPGNTADATSLASCRRAHESQVPCARDVRGGRPRHGERSDPRSPRADGSPGPLHRGSAHAPHQRGRRGRAQEPRSLAGSHPRAPARPKIPLRSRSRKWKSRAAVTSSVSMRKSGERMPTIALPFSRLCASNCAAGTRVSSATKGIAGSLRSKEAATFLSMRNKSLQEERYDGLFVLRTDTDHDAETIARVYKMLWMVEDTFRTAKSNPGDPSHLS